MLTCLCNKNLKLLCLTDWFAIMVTSTKEDMFSAVFVFTIKGTYVYINWYFEKTFILLISINLTR